MSFVDRRKIDPTLFPHRPKDTKERNIAISMSKNAWKKNVQIALSEKIIRLKNCSVPTQEPKNAKDRNNVITFKYIISVSSRNNLSHCIKFKYVYKYKQWIQHTSSLKKYLLIKSVTHRDKRGELTSLYYIMHIPYIWRWYRSLFLFRDIHELFINN